jgi:hypothetical protein
VTLTSFPNGATGLLFNYAGLISINKNEPWIGGTDCTAFLVHTGFNVTAYQYPRFISCATNSSDYGTFGNNDVQTQYSGLPVSFQTSNAESTISINEYIQPGVIWWQTTSSQITLNMNQTYTNSGGNQGTPWSWTSMGVGSWAPSLYAGANVGNAQYTFGELVYYNRNLTTTEVGKVLSYLYSKFGLSG